MWQSIWYCHTANLLMEISLVRETAHSFDSRQLVRAKFTTMINTLRELSEQSEARSLSTFPMLRSRHVSRVVKIATAALAYEKKSKISTKHMFHSEQFRKIVVHVYDMRICAHPILWSNFIVTHGTYHQNGKSLEVIINN
ncbi:hypothetical protein ALC53_00085 [Atta colombica]|uniref:Uncharacterized protein n=1 Tax=Atta colombica TaxID=520822 RepID=A0A195BXY2_9HYME|nr:hypothetical protein ALC53_00085 [Atta colombica]